MINQIIHGDCFDVLKDIPDNSIDLILTDPPYGLKFMGKDWDHGVPSVQFWEQALRVAKPGTHLMAFGGTRAFHRLAVAIEDAGWEIRDTLMWVYGYGFPKSLDVSKAIDKAAGAEREVVGKSSRCVGPSQFGVNGIGTFKEVNWADSNNITAPATPEAQLWEGWGTALKPAWEPIILARKPLIGTVAENVLKYGTGAINVDECRVKTDEKIKCTNGSKNEVYGNFSYIAGQAWELDHKGRWPANLIHDGSDEVVGLFPDSKSDGGRKGEIGKRCYLKSAKSNALSGPQGGKGIGGDLFWDDERQDFYSLGIVRRDSGSAARFFYCAKASRKERGEGNTHPTVKPLALIKYLITLGLPPGGTVLDPFCGSGTTALACKELGRNYICIEKELEYYRIACNRLNQPIEHIPDEPIEEPEEPVDNFPLQLALF